MAFTGESRARTGSFIDVKVDERALARAQKRLSQYEAAAFRKRMERVYRAGASLLVAPTRRAINSSIQGHGKNPGMLAKKVSVRKGRPSPGYVVRFGTKSRAPHSHLLARGHRRVAPGRGRGAAATGPPVHGYGFYEEVIAAYEDKVIDFISRNTLKEGVRAEAFTAGIRSF